MPDYKSLCAVVIICAILVNIHTHRHTGTKLHAQTKYAMTSKHKATQIQNSVSTRYHFERELAHIKG